MNALSVRGLSKTYRNGVQALKGIDLSVEQGDFFALLGPNGAGKTPPKSTAALSLPEIPCNYWAGKFWVGPQRES